MQSAAQVKDGIAFPGHSLKNLNQVYDLNEEKSELISSENSKKVYKVHCLQTKIPYVIKVINKSDFEPSALPLIWNQCQLFKLIDHPSIVKFIEAYNAEHKIYIVMEFVDGKTLDEVKNLPEDELCRIFYDIGSAVKHCHSLGLIHRGIQFNAFRLRAKNDVKLLSFGLCVRSNNEKSVRKIQLN
jgi:serine/threonine protein kinase